MEKRSINPNKAKFISAFLLALIFCILVLRITNLGFNKVLKKAESQYYSSLEKAADGYCHTILEIFNGYTDSLDAFYIPEIFNSADSEKIFDFIQTYDYKKNKDFDSVYYLDITGQGYFSNGVIGQLDIENHPILTNSEKYHYSSLVYIEPQDLHIFGIEKAIFDAKGNRIGALCASVSTQALREKILNIDSGSQSQIFIIDCNGNFVYNSTQHLIGTSFIPTGTNYKQYTSKYIFDTFENFLRIPNEKGELMDINLCSLPGCNMKLGVATPYNEIQSIYKQQNKTKLDILIFSLVLISILVLLELKMMNFFQKKQYFMSFYDSLTNLWTREHFELEAAKLLHNNSKSKFMMIEADIKGFKFINQNYGQQTANNVIVNYAKLLYSFVHDYPGIIGRGFADRFYIFIKVSSIHSAMNVFKEKVVEIDKKLADYEVPVFAKFGISFLLPNDSNKQETIQNLIGQASFAKSTIQNDAMVNYAIYHSRLAEKIKEDQFIESYMTQALADKEFYVVYQPKINLKTEKICGAEALVRWNNKTLGQLTPDKFIPLFEKNGFIKKLDFYVYEEVFKFLDKQISMGNKPVPISVNMSRNHNRPEKFIHDFMEIFHKYSIPPEYIQLEIIERSFMDNDNLNEITERLHKEGFSVAMDDFGSGESSLNMITKVPVDVLKFDRVFLLSSVDENGSLNDKSAEFIRILIDLSKNLEKESVFEGVETKEQYEFLKSINCDTVQGYFYSKPLCENEFLEFMKKKQ